MEDIKTYNTEEEVSTIQIYNKKIYFGTYTYLNGTRYGSINSIKNGIITKITSTTGTLQIQWYKDKLYSVNSKDITIENEIKKQTSCMNMSLDIFDDILFVSQEDGNVTQYTLDLIPVNIIKICDHIIWVCKSYKKYLFAGCDCGKFIIYDILTKSVIKEYIRRSGITSIYVKDNLMYVGGYDEFVFIYELNTFEEIQSKYIGGGIWRIITYDEQFIIACMYEGYKILDCELNIIKHIKTPGITYAIDYNDRIFVHSSFYEKEIKIYKN